MGENAERVEHLPSPEGEGGAAEGNGRRRWSAEAKAEVVMRLLRSEGLDGLSRESRVSAETLAGWRDEFIAAGKAGLRSRKEDLVEMRLKDAQAKIGDLTMRLEIAQAGLRKKGVYL